MEMVHAEKHFASACSSVLMCLPWTSLASDLDIWIGNMGKKYEKEAGKARNSYRLGLDKAH